MNNPELLALLSDPYWRINNLYYIVNKKGQKIKFNLNWAQEMLYRGMWYCNIVLKARQLGMSTFICILFLDRMIFNPHLSAGIIAHTLEDAQQIFRRVKFAYDNLPKQIRDWITADNNTAQMLKFSNGSSIRVGTSLRSSTMQYLHISEFGKICAKYPDKAKEIITGALNTLEVGQYCFIESTAEGREGYFYDLCKTAQANHQAKKELSRLEFKFNFFPWWGEPGYRIASEVAMGEDLMHYFATLKSLGIELDQEQKAWYAFKSLTQGEDMKREYPSTPDECWEVSNAGTYYAKHITNARVEKRICRIAYEEAIPVHTAWDIGYNDSNAIWFFQVYGKEIRLIEYLEGSGESLVYWIGEIKKRRYIYGKHLAPHDISIHEYSTGMSRISTGRKHGINFIPVQKIDINSGIDACRNILPSCWFDEKACKAGLHSLDNYKKEWDERLGCWKSSPLHNHSSHGADAFRTFAVGLPVITNVKSISDIERDKMQQLKDASGLYPGSYLYTPNEQSQIDRSQRFFG